MPIAQVALNLPVNAAFDYLAPGAGPGDVGRLAVVPLGRRTVVGVIVGVSEAPTAEGVALKPVKRILRDLPPLPEDILELARFCSEYYHHPLGQVLAGLLPQRLRRTEPLGRLKRPVWRLTEAGRAASPDALPARAVLRRRVLAALQAAGRLGPEDLAALSPGAAKAMATLVALGWAEQASEALRAATPVSPYPAPAVLPLNGDQRAAVEAIRARLDGFIPWLLLGVTGSGKTEVYLQVIAEVLARGGQALVLVPEINLTPQTEARFRARFPEAGIVSLHSQLGEGERLKNWLLAENGEARIVLGTRLAVFVPLPRLGLIVVDEEHDGSFKQQDGMRYSARDVAVFRAHQRGVPVILGSATPSLETWHNARTGRYRLLELRKRAVADARPPTVALIDVRREPLTEGLAAPLITAIRQRLRRGEQTLLFLNRRGYAPVLMCRACGWLAGCPRCSSRLVVHLSAQRMRCHHCGHEARIPRHCPGCGALDLAPVGQGTQRLEESLARLFPGARVLRVDRDSTRRRNALPEMLERVREREVDILVGTQMLAKGHDFPTLTLVGILDADGGLYSADFRAEERLFAQLLQVSGRAGRACANGEVLIQTAFPEHPLFAALRAGAYPAFADTLLAERRQLGLPPFSFQALLRAEAHEAAAVMAFLHQAAALAPPTPEVTVYDPVPALMPKRAGWQRAQLLVESRSRAALQRFLSAWMQALCSSKPGRVRWALDVDPMDP